MTKTGKWNMLYFDSFLDLKQRAYKIALDWKEQEYSQEWLESYTDQFAPSSDVWMYEDVIELYAKFLKGEITKEQAQEELGEFEVTYQETEEFLNEVFGFQLAMKRAFNDSKQDFGEVTFECPLCKGQAYGVRLSTPENVAHKVTIRGGVVAAAIR